MSVAYLPPARHIEVDAIDQKIQRGDMVAVVKSPNGESMLVPHQYGLTPVGIYAGIVRPWNTVYVVMGSAHDFTTCCETIDDVNADNIPLETVTNCRPHPRII